MRAVVFSGIQASGKSTFYRQHFAETHVRINLDMLRTRNRETILLHACLAAGQPLVVDNTNPTVAARRRYLDLARAAGFEVSLYHFQCEPEEAIARNAEREHGVPEVAIRGTAAKLEVPSLSEGFDQLFRVRITDGAFAVEEVLP